MKWEPNIENCRKELSGLCLSQVPEPPVPLDTFWAIWRSGVPQQFAWHGLGSKLLDAFHLQQGDARLATRKLAEARIIQLHRCKVHPGHI